ncbi:hypothetical protein [Streptomyces longwoodensis]|uniref:hypothetical protein n=1 Tax=Streptomyces longwoodensis TaxID=68231 RepID=UPI0033FBB959
MAVDLERDGAARSRTGERPPLWRPLAGGALAFAALPLLVVLPEVGLPVVFVALRLLASRFAWAARVDAALRRATARVRKRFAAMPRPLRTAVVAGATAAFAAVLWGTVSAAV